MVNQYNPFKENRAEQMKDLWKYYVPVPGLESTGKPIVVEGGRGSGKTMFFQCNSWRQLLSRIKKNERPASTLFDDSGFVGVYYRVDTTFVSSMRDREESHWEPIFETYFAICILQEIRDFVIELSQEMPIDESGLSAFIFDFSQRIYPKSVVDSMQGFRRETDAYLDAIEDKINCIQNDYTLKLRWVNAHRLISDLCQACNRLLKRELVYKVFIDEYETLQEYQQKIINTYIKHSTLPVIFSIGMKPKGMKTKETISRTETIEAPHDYERIPLSIDPQQYLILIKDICKKRIVLGKEQGKIPKDASEDISDYLGAYSIDFEIQRISKSSGKFPHLQKLDALIRKLGEDALLGNLRDSGVDTQENGCLFRIVYIA